jgi:tyrosyl-tRNA synthetase
VPLAVRGHARSHYGSRDALSIAELTRNAVHVLPAGALEAKLALGRPLRVKLGIDVTSPDIHVGRGIPLQRMRAFQDEGHIGVLIIGDYTTRIGDPSGRSTERPILSDEEINRNAQTYVEQAYQIVVPEQTEVRFNSEWLARLSFADVIRLTRIMTVAQMLERDDFADRYAAGQPVSVSELLYPLMQAYDSVAVEADVELGGTDQLYNLLAGRDVMHAYGLELQVVLTTPLLLSWDGEKMSSSVGNNIPLTAQPEEQFGRTMRISDELLPEWYRLVMQSDANPLAGDPLEAKLELARFIVARSHGEEAAQTAEAHFTRVVREGRAPDDIQDAVLPAGDPVHLPSVLAECFGLSTSEARRLIAQGGVKIDGESVRDLDIPRDALVGAVVQAGKRRFVRLS